MIFTDEFVSKLKPRIESLTIPCRAKIGTTAPIDVIIPKGPTGIAPADIKFFHALKLSTKIMKGQIEITAPKTVLTAGDEVGASEAQLLEKLDITPFSYGMKVLGVYYDGEMLEQDFINMSP